MRALLSRTTLITIFIAALLQGCGGGETASLFDDQNNVSNPTELASPSANDPFQKRITSGAGSGNAGQIVGAVIGIFDDMSLAYDIDLSPNTPTDTSLRQPTLSGFLNWLLLNLDDLSHSWPADGTSTVSLTCASGNINITWNDNDHLLQFSATDTFNIVAIDCVFGDNEQIISGNLSASNFSSSDSAIDIQASFSLADLTIETNEEKTTFTTNNTDDTNREVFLFAHSTSNDTETGFTLTLDAANSSQLIINREIQNAPDTGGSNLTTDIISNPLSAGNAELSTLITLMDDGSLSYSLSMNAVIYLDTTEGTVNVQTITPLIWEEPSHEPSSGIFKITGDAQTSVTVDVASDSLAIDAAGTGIGANNEIINEACPGSLATWNNLKRWAIVISDCASGQ